MRLKLYNTAHSGPSFRVRIALGLKGLDYDYVPVDLKARAHRSAAYRALNPQGLLPALDVDGAILTQSGAIVEWLDETYRRRLSFRTTRPRVRAIAAVVGTDVAPLHSMRVMAVVRDRFGQGEDGMRRWARHFIVDGFAAIERLLGGFDGPYACGAQPGIVDIYLVPAVYIARRAGIEVEKFGRIAAASAHAAQHPAFAAAHPSKQPDAGGSL